MTEPKSHCRRAKCTNGRIGQAGSDRSGPPSAGGRNKKSKKTRTIVRDHLTNGFFCDNILKSTVAFVRSEKRINTERYRSGHNEAVLKPPCHTRRESLKTPVSAGIPGRCSATKFFFLIFFLMFSRKQKIEYPYGGISKWS